ncbi:MAG: restriction endonuclease subunit M [Acetobacteraceae bacterium]|nr:restriction endonuclease subunit M [Acetobacteraceae bacterium]
MTVTLETLERFGVDPGNLRLFGEDGPELLPYATLTAARTRGDADLDALFGVYEWQDAPLMFLVDADRLGSDGTRLVRIRRMAAMRGDAPYLGVVAPGRLDVYRVALDADPIERARVNVGIPDNEQAATFAYLSNVRPESNPPNRGWIAQVILDLLDDALDTLTQRCGLTIEDAISLVGRALFARFLGDRGLLPEPLRSQAVEGTLFDSANVALTTSDWLDGTFNGDFLPFSGGTFERLPIDGFKVLGDIARRAAGGQLALGWAESWDDLNFAHIPVGVLSQAYERYLSKHDAAGQRSRGGYYTPRHIAELMVRGAFAPLVEEGRAAKARVLDPASGAGVFLLATFRRIVAERWRSDRTRPGTGTLRKILYEQITGFDIDESALRFAALGLYLMSIELDPDPEPVGKLAFENLRGRVLHRAGSISGNATRGLGSLDPDFHASPGEGYDLVIGNPPWASGTKLPGWPRVLEAVTAIADKRSNGTTVRPTLPNEGLDLPFVWRAMEWARPGGQIAFALHARLLFQQGDSMPQAREALFGALDVTGVVNGAELRQTKVWPEVSAPFCLLFARNQMPGPEAAFRFVSPRLEPSLNGAGTMRIDATRADLVTTDQVTRRPEILKILFRGGSADLRLIERIETGNLVTIRDYWERRFGIERGHLRFAGNGYQHLRKSSRVRKTGDGLPGCSAAYLHGLPEITDDSLASILIQINALPLFDRERIHDPRRRTLFSAPILVVHKSPPAGKMRIQVGLAMNDVIFSESYYGYSAAAHQEGARLLRFLGLVIGSKPALWLTLLTSGEFGFERDVLEKSTIDGILVPDFDSLTRVELDRVDELFDGLSNVASEETWTEVDAWAAQLYGLQPQDLQVIDDTLRFNLPFAACRAAARARTQEQQVTRFRKVLESELQPWARRNERTIAVHSAPAATASAWRGLQIRVGAATEGKPAQLATDWQKLLRAADQLASSLMIYRDDEAQCLWVELLDQARYWSNTEARSLARLLVWSHIDFLTGRRSV